MKVDKLPHEQLNILEVKKLDSSAITPTRSYEYDAGLDLYASADTLIHSYHTEAVKTDIAVNIPPGYEGQIRPRSGKTRDTSLRVQIGTIDASYNGEIRVICDCHHSDLFYRIEKGEKIAQLVISPIETPQVEVVESFEYESERGSNGFGHSGE